MNTASRRRPLQLAVAAAAPVVVAALVYVGFSPQPRLGGRPECPITEPDSVIVDKPYVSTAAKEIPVAGVLTHIPEFHDCQRFIVRGLVLPWFWRGWRYGALYAIFASQQLDSLWVPTEKAGDTARSRTSDWIVVAEIVSWNGTYGPLGIDSGFNCLYLAGPENPRAAMVHYGPANPRCEAGVPLENISGGHAGPLKAKELLVRRDTTPKFGIANYPPVARWDWDSVHAKHYIGIACGAAWCEIGDTGFVSSSELRPGPGSALDRRVAEIRGWYDEQRLNIGWPGPIKGTVYADPGLDTLKVSHFAGRWIPAAYAALTDGHPAYFNKFRFVKTPLLAPIRPVNRMLKALNTIELCQGTVQECRVAKPPARPCEWAPPPDSLWWARIMAAGGKDTVYKCVVRRGHSKLAKHIPGAVRWRWTAGDETTWMRCDQGCCEVRP